MDSAGGNKKEEKEEFSERARLLVQAQLRQLGRPSEREIPAKKKKAAAAKASRQAKKLSAQEASKLSEACTALLELEKRSRQAEDARGTRILAIAVVSLCGGAAVPAMCLPGTMEEEEEAAATGSAGSADGSKTEKDEGSESESAERRVSTATDDYTPSLVLGAAAAPDFDLLLEMLALLVKRRGQLKTVVQAVIRAGMSLVIEGRDPEALIGADDALDAVDLMQTDSGDGDNDTDDLKAFFSSLSGDADRLKLMRSLFELTAGKIFVEVERARLAKLQADTYESEGKLLQASEVMQSVQVETFGAMEKREKTAFILHQMRLCLAVGDFIKTQILSRKIARRVLNLPALADLKVQYFMFLARYHAHDANWLECARAFLEMYHTLPQTIEEREAERVRAKQRALEEEEGKEGKGGDTDMNEAMADNVAALAQKKKKMGEGEGDKKESPKSSKQVLEEATARDARKDISKLQLAAILCALAPFDAEQSDLMARIAAEKRLQTSAACEAHRQVLALLQKKEIVAWSGLGDKSDLGGDKSGDKSGSFSDKYWGASGVLRAQLRTLDFCSGPHMDACCTEEKLTVAMRDRVTEHSVRTVAHYYDRISLGRLAALLGVSVDEAEQYVSGLVVKGTVWARIDRPGGVVNFRAGMTLRPATVLNDWGGEVARLLRLVDTSCHLVARENMVQKLPA
jgi:26S proteasome regulatory subunit N5